MSAAPRPRLLWVNHFAVPPGEGGGTRHFEIAREMVRGGWDVTIAASDLNLHSRRYGRRDGPGDRAPVAETLEGVGFRWLWAAPYQRNDWRRAANWLTFSWGVARWPRAAPRADVVVGSSPHLFAALAAERLARRWGVPFVLEVRDLWPEGLVALGARRGPGYHVLDRIARHLYARADRIVVLARGTGDYLVAERGVAPERVQYVPNGVDVDAFPAAPRAPREGFTAVYAGAHGPANGLDTVLDAAERLRGEPGIRFLLVGDGPVKAQLVASAAERGLGNVEFRDPVAKRDVPALLAEADAGLMVLADADLFSFGVSPNKLFDYFAASLPVVCNVPGDVARMVAEAGAGEQAGDARAAALADAVVRLARRSPAEREAMGAAGRVWVTREHARPRLAERLDGALRPLLAR